MNHTEREQALDHIAAIKELVRGGNSPDARADSTIADLLRQVSEVVSATYGAEDVRVERDRLRQEARDRQLRGGRNLTTEQYEAQKAEAI